MSLKTLITVLVLGVSSAAMARPIYIEDTRDHRTTDEVASPDSYRMRWSRRPITLANDAQLTSNLRDHRGERPLFIDVDERTGAFSKLRLDLSFGRIFVDSVVVMYPNGATRTYTVKQALSRGTPSIVVDIANQPITGMYIYGMSMRGRGTFDVVGLRR